MRVSLRSLARTYCAVDPRSLGLFRIGFGLVLLFDLLRRYQEIDFWYTNQGLLPNHTLLWRPPADHVFSLFFAASSRFEASLGFAACALVYGAFLFGYRTGVAQVLALVCRVSLNSRLAVLENGGDMVLNLLCIFTVALPLGRRFSVDAWLGVLRASGEPALTAALRERARAPVVSAAMLGLILQFAAIYLFNAVSKNGPAWTDGHAVHYALHQDKYVTALGVWMREQLPVGMLQGITWGVLAVEWLGFALIITPVFRDSARLLAVCLLPALHTAFALGLNLGAFSPAMIAFFPLLLAPSHWDGLARWWGRRRDGPLGRAFARGSRVAARARTARLVVHWASLHAAPAPSESPARVWALNGAALVLIAAVGIEALNDNTSVPAWLRVPRTAWSKAIVEYPRLLQGWRMFAPEPPLFDSMIHVEAVTAEGARVDPYNAVASRHRYPSGTTVPVRMDQSQFFTMYSDRIGQQGYAAYRHAFLEWLLAHPQRTGRDGDCLTAFDVYLVVDRSPPHGSREPPAPVRRERFMQYRAPREGPCRPLQPERGEAVAQRGAR